MYSSQWFLHIVNQWQSIKVIIIQIGEKIRNMYEQKQAQTCPTKIKWPWTDNRAFVSAGRG